ncbi:amidohydrolase family protein [Allobranchiibius sp. GilTou38]|uniref:amidohydrolase family protein n=1 Tax=Allobranchiibius sp. GilTou38 TaxID=2815210 RepID=UPI001AA1B4EA|nr:amidohydrolase family protein [Allobranchiibius sp. GilTou38]MBO1766753.1 amidohydrolase family protein [Allobranchiibius sp. GilTou38]
MTTTLLQGGTIIDPATGSEIVGDLLLSAGRVAAVGAHLRPPDDGETINVAGMVVGPGFVDLHSHVHTVAGQRLQAMDGVTTSLDLESGVMPLARAYAEAAAQGRPLNYGFSASWGDARGQVLAGVAPTASIHQSLSLLSDPAWQGSSTPAQRAAWLDLLRDELAEGALGIGILMGYAPYSDPEEYLAVARLAAEAGVPTYTHVRELVEADPRTPIDGVEEVVRAASETGAAMHHCHVNSTSRRHIDRVLATLSRAQEQGSRVTVESYPYGAGSTAIGAVFLAPERLGAWGLKPSSLVLLPSGERIENQARLRQIRADAPGTACVVEFLDEHDPDDQDRLTAALAYPDSIVASDAMPVLWSDGTWETTRWPLPEGGSTHPRTAGTFCRSLRMMVRESGRWSWPEAFRRCSYLPARVLDDAAPAARAKGHLGVGADADVVVLDPHRVTDMATYLMPTATSRGVQQVFVNGEGVVRDGHLRSDAFPGRPLRAEPR